MELHLKLDLVHHGLSAAVLVLLATSGPARDGPGPPRCFGFSAGASPCGNFLPGATTGFTKSSGHGGLLTATGYTSVKGDDIVFTVSGMPAHAGTLLIAACQSGTTPLGSSLLCVSERFYRGGWKHTITGSTGSVQFDQPVQFFAERGLIIHPGDAIYFQGLTQDSHPPCGRQAPFGSLKGRSARIASTNGYRVEFTH